MRTLLLEEFGPGIEAALSADEVRALVDLRPPLIDLSPTGAASTYKLRAGSTVGTVVLPSLRILVRPKVSLESIFFLLGYGSGLTRWGPERFPYEETDDLLAAVGWVFEAEVRAAAAQGLARGYQERDEALPTVRGRIDFARQIRLRQARPYPIDCRYEEYCEDTELNRVIRAAHHRLLPIPSLPAEVARRLRRTISFFSGVTDVNYPQGAVPALRFDRMIRHWEPAGRLAELILRQQTIRDQEGRIVGSTFTVDMNKLFERFITTVVEREARRTGWTVSAQARRNLTQELVMQPDLVLVRDGRDHAVGDAKYKELPSGDLRHPDMYQLLAYIVALGLRRGLLIYAQDHPLREQVVQRAGVKLEIFGVNLQGRPNEILESAQAAARRLIQHGNEARDRSDGSKATTALDWGGSSHRAATQNAALGRELNP